MDNTKVMYFDKVTGSFGEEKNLIRIELSAAERYYLEKIKTPDDRRRYVESVYYE
jgi:hypothetical protein